MTHASTELDGMSAKRSSESAHTTQGPPSFTFFQSREFVTLSFGRLDVAEYIIATVQVSQTDYKRQVADLKNSDKSGFKPLNSKNIFIFSCRVTHYYTGDSDSIIRHFIC